MLTADTFVADKDNAGEVGTSDKYTTISITM